MTFDTGRQTVGLCLTKGDETDATLAYLRAHQPSARVEDHGTFYRVESEQAIHIELESVALLLGRTLPLRLFLVSVASYFGRVEIDDDLVTITPAMLLMG